MNSRWAYSGAVIQDLPDYRAWVRTLVCDDHGCRPAEPEQIATYPPLTSEPGVEWRGRIVRTSNERYTKPRHAVDGRIERFLLGTREKE